MVDSDEPPLSLLSVNAKLQDRILSKLDYFTLARMEGTCQEISERCKNQLPEFHEKEIHIYPLGTEWFICSYGGPPDYAKKYSFNKDSTVPCKIIAENVFLHSHPDCDDYYNYAGEPPPLTLENARLIVAAIGQCNLRAKNFFILFGHNLQGLIEILEALKVESFFQDRDFTEVSRKICDFDVFKNLSSIRLWIHNFHDEDLLKLRARRFDLHNSLARFTEKGVNSLLKEWKSGQRELDYFFLHPIRSWEKANEIFEGLDAMQFWKSENVILYSIGRPSDTNNRRILAINSNPTFQTFIEITSEEDEDAVIAKYTAQDAE